MMTVRSRFGDYPVRFAEFVGRQDAPDGRWLSVVDLRVFEAQRMGFPECKIPHRLDDAVLVSAGEQLKSLGQVHEGGVLALMRSFHARNVGKDAEVHVVGGGTVQDAAAFVCAIWRRGLKWIYYPTTLLSMADSCIGAKCGINFAGKNDLGLFSAPSEVRIVPAFLDTLPEAEILSGLGEVFKLYWIGGVQFEWYPDTNLRRWKVTIEDCLSVKQAYIEADELEQGGKGQRSNRLHLSYGHTLAHAIEAVVERQNGRQRDLIALGLDQYAASYKHLPHGTAVALGMLFANWVSHRLGFLGQHEHYKAFQAICRITGAWKVPDCVPEIMAAIRRDKKADGIGVSMVLTSGPGEMLSWHVSFEAVERFLREYLVKCQ